jgi:MarR family transcriptional regulator, transcriptional regulator for hemolysin
MAIICWLRKSRVAAHSADSNEDVLLRILWEIPRLWRSAMDRRLKPLGLSEAKWRAVLHLARGPANMNQRELADRLGIEAPTLARLLDRLAADGWIERRTDPADRRARSIFLLPKASGLIRQIDRAIHEMRAEVLKGVQEKDIRASLKVLQVIRERTETMSVAARTSAQVLVGRRNSR